MFRQKVKDKMIEIAAKYIKILLIAGICLFNSSLSFAEFETINKERFSASVTIGSFVDSDYDGIPDGWEEKYGLDFIEHDEPGDPDTAYGDNDNDGLTNLEEYRNSSDPTESNSGIIASITADPLSGPQPLTVELTAQYEYEDGYTKYPIVKYEWDFDGNGTYDYSSREPSVEYKFTASGEQNVVVRVTNKAGGVGIGAADPTINVTKIATSPDAITDQTQIPASIPESRTFSGTRSDDIAVYQWDLTGNGEYEFTSTKSPTITHTYRNVKRRSFNACFKVTDTKGLSDRATKGIRVDSLSWYNTEDWVCRPKVLFNCERVITGKKAGDEILLSGYGIPAGYSSGREKELPYIRKLEWDFESDGIYDYAAEVNNPEWAPELSALHTYGAPGIYRATLRATTDLEPPHDITITATDHVLVIVEDSGGDPPTAAATVSYRGSGPIAEINDTLPINAKFDHSASSSSNSIVKYEWDFDGDKKIDYINTNPHKKFAIYHYRLPGYYLACLTVTDENGLTDTAYIPVFAYMPDAYASAITMPEEGQSVAGSAVTLTCDVFPDTGVDTVMFQYRAEGTDNWADIGLGQPVASYMTTWDATGLDGDYEVRAIVNGDIADTDGDRYKIMTIEVDAANPDIYEDDSKGYTKKVKIDSGKSNSIVLNNGTSIDIPLGAIAEDETVTINENTVFSAGAGNSIDISVEGEGSYTFLKDITIIIPYSDADVAGRDEDDLVIMWYNEDAGEWQPLYDSVVYPDENYIAAKINHLSLFGAGFISWGSAVFGGGATVAEGAISYCFIATAAYGSADADDVMILREFRDRFLLTNPLGQRFVSCYYKYSPPIAKHIAKRPVLKKITRLVLKPLVKFAKWRLYEARSRTIE